MEFNFETFISPYREILTESGGSNMNLSRYKNYEYVINKLVAKKKPLKIIETGTMSGDHVGAFTLIFADLIHNWTGGSLTTIDISEDHINKCKELTKEFSSVINYVLSDSVSYLQSLSDQEVLDVDYFYFDSYDLFIPDPVPSQLHHYREFEAVYSRLSEDVIITVDDNYLPHCWVMWDIYDSNRSVIESIKYETGNRIMGKGTLIDCFLLDQGWKRIDDFLHLSTVHMLTYEK